MNNEYALNAAAINGLDVVHFANRYRAEVGRSRSTWRHGFSISAAAIATETKFNSGQLAPRWKIRPAEIDLCPQIGLETKLARTALRESSSASDC